MTRIEEQEELGELMKEYDNLLKEYNKSYIEGEMSISEVNEYYLPLFLRLQKKQTELMTKLSK